jgi:hypothetical protein
VEWLVWDSIPKKAMINTFSLESFLDEVNGSTILSKVLQLPIVRIKSLS